MWLAPGDSVGWAIDEDRRLTRAALEGLVEWVDEPRAADVIHAAWWERVVELEASACAGRRVVCHATSDVGADLGRPEFQTALARVTDWVAQSRRAAEELRLIAPRVHVVPYTVDDGVFCPGPAPVTPQIPAGSYVVGNFSRDTLGPSFSGGEVRAKWEKGPEVFAEVVSMARELGAPVVVLLAGPRRQWLRARLAELGVPTVFVGRDLPLDDFPANTLSAGELAVLYRRLDVHLVCSRSEGGPRTVLEAAATGVGQVSTPVPLAVDVLTPACVSEDPVRLAELLVEDWRSGAARRFARAQRETVLARHTVGAAREAWRTAYGTMMDAPLRARVSRRVVTASAGLPRRVCVWTDLRPPPWGGANQFLIALRGEMERRGIEVCVNGEGDAPGAHLLNAVWFDTEAFERVIESQSRAGDRPRVVHRIDGPINLIRRTADSAALDARVFDLNARHADATIVQSRFVLRCLAEQGVEVVRPVLVPNAPDAGLFFPRAGDDGFGAGDRPLRVVASSWSNNPGKGAAVYRWIDEHVEHAALTFVGRMEGTLRRGRVVDALPSGELAEALRAHDVYVTASRDDPCSNALAEALACGLPAAYFDSGGHRELVGLGGLAFRYAHELPGVLRRLGRWRERYRRVLRPLKLDEVATVYLRVLLGDAAYRE